MILDEEEKKREKEFERIVNSINGKKSDNFSNSFNNSFSNNSDNPDYETELEKFNEIINSINPIKKDFTGELDNSINYLDDNTNFTELDVNNISDTNNINNNGQKDRKGKGLFTTGAFSDGYQFGDITRTTLGTISDVTQDLASGAASVVEAPIDIGANVVATVQDVLGFDEAAKKTREWADKNYSEKVGNFVANVSPVGALYHLTNGTFGENIFENDAFEESSLIGETGDKIVNLVGYTGGLALGGKILNAVGLSSTVALNLGGHTLNLPVLAFTGGMSSGLQEANSKGDNVTEFQRWSKALMGGTIESLTESISEVLGVGGSDLTEGLIKTATNKMSSGIAKTLTKIGIQSTGEAVEEFLSYAGNYVTDNLLINNIGRGDFKTEWNWKDVGEQMALAFASTVLTSGSSTMVNNNKAIESAEQQLGRELTDEEKTKVTQTVIDAELKANEESEQARKLDPKGKGKSVIHTYIATFNTDGEVKTTVPVLGKLIKNPNTKVNIKPAVFENTGEIGGYNVVDTFTGVLIDNTPYQTVQEAETGFSEKINNLDEAGVKAINQKISNSNMSLYNHIQQEITKQFIEAKPQEEKININNVNIQNAQNVAETTASAQKGLAQNGKLNSETIQTNENGQESNFGHATSNYAVQDIKKLTDEFEGKEALTKNEVAEIWNDIEDRGLDVTYDDNGDMKTYVAIEESGNNLVVNRYDSEDNIVDSVTIISQDGKFNTQEIKDTIKQVATLYDENKPIVGQTDIEGNEVRRMKRNTSKNTEDKSQNNKHFVVDNKMGEQDKNKQLIKGVKDLSNEEIRNIVKSSTNTNSMQSNQNYTSTTINEIQNITDNIKKSNIQLNKRYYKKYSNITDILNNELLKKRKVVNILPNSKIEKLNIDTMSIVDLKQKAKEEYNNNHNSKLEIDGFEIKLSNRDIDEIINNVNYNEHQKKYIKEQLTLLSQLKKIINNVTLVTQNPEGKNRKNNILWNYYIADFKLNNNIYTVIFDVVSRDNGENHLRIQYITLKNNIADTSTEVTNNSTISATKVSATNTNIPQNNGNVKSSTNTNSMQNNKNNSQNGVKRMEKTTRNNLSTVNESTEISNNERISNVGKTLNQNNNKDFADVGKIETTDLKTIQKELHNRIQNAILSKNSRKNTFLGKVSQKVVDKIKKMYGIDVSGRNHIISDNDIRHIIKQHGNQTIEKTKGQIAITTKDIEKIPDIINNYDEIEKGSVNKDKTTSQENDTIRYIKAYQNNVTYVVEVAPANTKQLIIKTMWKRPMDINKKNNSSRVNHANNTINPQNTPEAEPTSSYSNNSIAQKNKNVKNDTNIPMENVKTSNELAKRGNIMYNSDGIQLGKRELAVISSAINTDTPNLPNGINYKFHNDNFYMFEKINYNNYKFIGKLSIENNEDLIKDIRKEIYNGSFKGTETIGRLIKELRATRRRNNNDNNSSTRTRKDGQTNRLHNGNMEQELKLEQRRNSKESLGNQPRINDNDSTRAMKMSKTNTSSVSQVDNQGRTLSKQQQEYFKNSKVRDESGKLLTVYHGTDTEFYTFNYNRLGENTSSLGAGFYFTDQKKTALDYTRGSKNLKEVYIDIEKPLSYGKTTMTKTEYRKFIEAINKETNESYLEDYGGLNEALLEYDYGGDDIDLVNAVHETSGLTWEKTYEILKDTTKFDGIISEKGFLNKDETIYVVFNSNQIKNVNNTSPTTDKDIRFAKRSAKTYNTQRNAERENAYIEREIQKIEGTGNWDDSIPVTRMTDIKKTIEDYLGIGIEKGHFREQAYGIYKDKRDIIRTTEIKDMDTILHETGHALDLGKRLKIEKEAISDELLNAVNKYGGYETESRNVQLDEGFAEIIREYSIVPEQAKTEYPQTITVLEGIRQNDQDFDNFMTNIQQQTYNYIHQNPRNRFLSNQSIGKQTDKEPLTKDSIKRKILKDIWDESYDIKEAVEELQKAQGKSVNNLPVTQNAYLLTRLASGIGTKTVSMLSNGYIDENGTKLMPGLSQIGEILGDNPERYNDLRAYLVAKRDLDYKAKNLKTGLRRSDSEAVIKQFENDAQIQEATKIIYDTLDGVMQYAINNGLISDKDMQKIKESNAFYVPMQRVIERRGSNVGRRGQVSSIIKSRIGSELDIKDVLENIVSNSANIIRQVENNNVLKALYNQGEASGLTGSVYDVIPAPMKKIGTENLSVWENELQKQGVDTSELDLDKTIDLFAPNNKINTQELITSFINDNGKRVYLQFRDELTFNSIMNLDKKTTSKVLKIIDKLNAPLKFGATIGNLTFAVPNAISDTIQATIFSEAGFIPIVDNALGVLDILTATNSTVQNFMNKVAPNYVEKVNNMYTLYEQSGASSATMLSQYRKSTQKIMEKIYGTKDSQTLGIDEKFKPLKRLLDFMTFIPELSELSTRFRVYERNYNYYKIKDMTETEARVKAALQSKDATQDFSRGGTFTKEIGKLIPFTGARVGSVYTFAEKVKANPKQVGMRLAILTAIAMAIKAIGYDDDEIEELNQRKKDDNFVLKVGDNVVTIKKPQGVLRSYINLAEYIQDLATGHIEEGKEGKRLGEWLKSAIMDNMPADEITGLVPNPITPLIENMLNKDFYYNTDIVKNYDLELPDEQQYYEYNSQLAILLGKIFNYSPAKIDNLISGYFGGVGTQLTGIIDNISSTLGLSAKRPKMGAESDTIGKRFVVNVNSNSASLDEIYNRKTELTKLKNGGTITGEETKELETLTEAISNISKINKQIKEIKKSLTMSGEDKATQIKELQKQRTDIARQALGKDMLYPENDKELDLVEFFPTKDTLSKNKYTLNLTSDMKEEYAELANEYYSKYENQNIYNEDKLEQIKTKAKDYAKDKLFQKYKSRLIKP